MNFIPQTQTRTPYVPVESTTLNFLSIAEHSVANLLTSWAMLVYPQDLNFSQLIFGFCPRTINLKVTAILFAMVINSWDLALSFWKEYLPNLLETWLLHQIFVFWVRDLKFWLLAYFLFPLTLQRLANIDIRHFIRVPPLNFW